MFEKSILQDIAEQNFMKYEVNYKSPKPVIVSKKYIQKWSFVYCESQFWIKIYFFYQWLKDLGIFWLFRSYL